MAATHEKGVWSRIRSFLHLDDLSPGVRRVFVSIVGGILLLVGLAMLVLPGPAFIMIPVGLAILASEFLWARRYLNKARQLLQRGQKKWKQRRSH